MKFFAAIKAADFASKLSEAAGFDFAKAFAAGDVNALKVHIEAESAKAVAAASKPDAAMASQVETLNASLAEATRDNETLTAALSGIGFTIPDDQTTTTGALQSHIKIRAQGILAQAGHPAISTAGEVIAGNTLSRAAFNALTPDKQMEFARGGGLLTE